MATRVDDMLRLTQNISESIRTRIDSEAARINQGREDAAGRVADFSATKSSVADFIADLHNRRADAANNGSNQRREAEAERIANMKEFMGQMSASVAGIRMSMTDTLGELAAGRRTGGAADSRARKDADSARRDEAAADRADRDNETMQRKAAVAGQLSGMAEDRTAAAQTDRADRAEAVAQLKDGVATQLGGMAEDRTASAKLWRDAVSSGH